MAELTFEQLRFEDKNEEIRVWFLRYFYFDVSRETLEADGAVAVEEHSLLFEGVSQDEAEHLFMKILEEGLNNLTNSLSHNPTVYVHKGSGIPLTGLIFLGIVDRGSTSIEIKPLTSCNINCIFCSVDEGISSKKEHEFVIEKDYLVQECEKLLAFKGEKGMKLFINTHGEPTLYAPLIDLVRDLSKNDYVDEIHLITNGTILSHEDIDALKEAGLTEVNLSINAIDPLAAKKMAGYGKYDIARVLDLARYIAPRMKLTVAPVYTPGYNEEEMPKIIAFAKELGASIGIQNFLEYRGGRNPTKGIGWDSFNEKLREWEKEFDVQLLYDSIAMKKTKQYPRPFRKGDIVKVELVCPGRMHDQSVGVAEDRAIYVLKCPFSGRKMQRVKILSAKDNNYTAVIH